MQLKTEIITDEFKRLMVNLIGDCMTTSCSYLVVDYIVSDKKTRSIRGHVVEIIGVRQRWSVGLVSKTSAERLRFLD